MKLTLINPNLITQKGDFSGSGIPFMPITLAYTAGYLRKKGHDLNIIDAFGENPRKIVSKKGFFIQGIGIDEILKRIPQDTEAVVLYASLVITHNANIKIIRTIKERLSIPVIVIENIHSVVGCSLLDVQDDLIDAGADYLVLSDPEKRTDAVLQSIKKGKTSDIDGVIYFDKGKRVLNAKKRYSKDIDELPFPAWDLFPLKNYWQLAYSHAPIKESYLPLLTSRGCPYNCEFCITPKLTARLWRPRSAENVVDELEHNINTLNVREFHIEDFNPTISKQRIVDICKEILKRGIKVELKIVAGTKAETIDKETLDWMKKAGFSYVSISPESGSKRVLDKMNKEFDHHHATQLVKHMDKIGITSQACFVIGFPGEENKDLKLTQHYIKELVKAGIDEIALFIMTPIPGSNAAKYSTLGYNSLSQVTFSPKWRNAYKNMSRFRTRTYAKFLLWKLIYHPIKLVKHPYNLITKQFNTKIEMALWRVIRMHIKALTGDRL